MCNWLKQTAVLCLQQWYRKNKYGDTLVRSREKQNKRPIVGTIFRPISSILDPTRAHHMIIHLENCLLPGNTTLSSVFSLSMCQNFFHVIGRWNQAGLCWHSGTFLVASWQTQERFRWCSLPFRKPQRTDFHKRLSKRSQWNSGAIERSTQGFSPSRLGSSLTHTIPLQRIQPLWFQHVIFHFFYNDAVLIGVNQCLRWENEMLVPY